MNWLKRKLVKDKSLIPDGDEPVTLNSALLTGLKPFTGQISRHHIWLEDTKRRLKTLITDHIGNMWL